MIKLSGLAIAQMGAIQGAGSTRRPQLGPVLQTPVSLPQVRVQPERIIRQDAGLRPYRPSGFVVRAERMDPKTIIHNYGHGGAGVTLSWGTADLAVSLALQTADRQAAVLGCGAVGLATARLLQDRGFDVTIYAKDLPPNTTSNVAAAMWGPVNVVDEKQATPAFMAQLEHAARFAHRYFQHFVTDRYGVRWIETFLVGSEPQTFPWADSVTRNLLSLVPLPPEENPFPTQNASQFYTMQMQTHIYLAAILADFLLRGGRLVVREFGELASVLNLPEPVIVNCTGLGARALFGDQELVPIKGQLLVLLPQPEINYAYIDGARGLHMFPRQDGILLGETHEAGITSLEPSQTEADRIFEGNRQFFEAMRE
jgi:glycine/D-amino acid oxidase-like deaminating enzyme